MKAYFSIEGQIGRLRYILNSVVFDVLAALAFYGSLLPVAWLIYVPNKSLNQWLGYAVCLLVAVGVGLVCTYVGTVLRIKRLHGLGRSGWDVLLLGIPFYNVWLFIQLWFFRSLPVGSFPVGRRPVYRRAYAVFLLIGAAFWVYGLAQMVHLAPMGG